jgi:multiple sugar transport system ATP-binding protein
MRLQIAALRRRLSATFIYVTHDQVEAMTLADIIVVLRNGVIEQVGSPMALYHNPANLFVAGFIGSPKMNFIPATLGAPEAGLVRVDLRGGAHVRLPARAPDEGVSVTLGIRPEHIFPDINGPIAAEVQTVEDLGAYSYAYAALADGTLVTVQLPPTHTVVLDQLLRLSLDPAHAFLFDGSGRAIPA